jgi:hypothetical protein
MTSPKLLSAIYDYGSIGGIGNIGNIGTYAGARSVFIDTISKIIGVLTLLGSLWFIFQLITAAISWIGSGGDKQALQNAQKRITNAVLGLLIVIFAYTIIALVAYFLGFDFLDMGAMLNKIGSP